MAWRVAIPIMSRSGGYELASFTYEGFLKSFYIAIGKLIALSNNSYE